MSDHWFLPLLRSKISADAQPPSTGGGFRRKLSAQYKILADGSEQPGTYDISSDIVSAGDIASIMPEMISSVEPRLSGRPVEPNYFPYVTFVDADFPWRYSQDGGTDSKTKPWLALIALASDEFSFVDQGNGLLPQLRTAASNLPNLDELWAHVHVQVNKSDASGASDDLESYVKDRPQDHFARMLCPRKLKEGQVYYLFLVPSFKIGLQRGLGQKVDVTNHDDPSWEATDLNDIDLPYYWKHSFSTSELGDFESLIRKLRYTSDGEMEELGSDPVFSGRPGFVTDVDGSQYNEADETFLREGALELALPDDQRAPDTIVKTALIEDLTQKLDEAILSELKGMAFPPDEGEVDPLVSPPPYGWRFRKNKSVNSEITAESSPKSPWLSEVNLDLRYRLGAGDGARVVKDHQELFMQQCWEQVGDIQAVNLKRQRLQVSQTLTKIIDKRHFNKLPSDIALVLSSSVHDLVPSKTFDGTIAAELEVNGVPRSYVTPASRAIMAKRPVRFKDVDGQITCGIPSAMIPGTSGGRLHGAMAYRTPRFNHKPKAKNRNFLTDAGARPSPVVRKFMSGNVFGGKQRSRIIVKATNVRVQVATISSFVVDIPLLKADSILFGLTQGESATLEPVWRGPRITLPFAQYLSKENPQLILPNIEKLPDNRLLLLAENRRYIESFMVGANHEMNQELRWREYPSDMRTTVFQRFWDRGASSSVLAADDIKPIDKWKDKLGKNFKIHDKKGNMFILIRGEIIRRYGEVLVSLKRVNNVATETWEDDTNMMQPLFSGMVGDDAAYYAFNLTELKLRAAKDKYFFLFHERPGKLRFGLDIATYQTRMERRDTSKTAVGFPVTTLGGRRSTGPELNLSTMLNPANKGSVSSSLKCWNDISWSHVTLGKGGYIDFSGNSFPSVPEAKDKNGTPVGPSLDLWGSTKTSAGIARALRQKPVRLIVKAKRLFPDG